MSDHEDAAAAVLASYTPITADGPKMRVFEQDVPDDLYKDAPEGVVVRPSPAVDQPDPVVAALQIVVGQLTTIVHQNAAIIELLGGGRK